MTDAPRLTLRSRVANALSAKPQPLRDLATSLDATTRATSKALDAGQAAGWARSTPEGWVRGEQRRRPRRGARQIVLDALAGGPRTTAELAAVIGGALDRHHLHTVLAGLCDAGEVVRVRTGIYRLPEPLSDDPVRLVELQQQLAAERPEGEHLADALTRAAQTITELLEVPAEEGLPPRGRRLLLLLSRTRRGLTVGQLQEQVPCSRAALYRVIAALRARGERIEAIGTGERAEVRYRLGGAPGGA